MKGDFEPGRLELRMCPCGRTATKMRHSAGEISELLPRKSAVAESLHRTVAERLVASWEERLRNDPTT